MRKIRVAQVLVAITALAAFAFANGDKLGGTSGTITKDGYGPCGTFTTDDTDINGNHTGDQEDHFKGSGTFPLDPLAGDFYWDPAYGTYEQDPGSRGFATLYFVVWTTQLPGHDPVHHYRLYMHNYPYQDILKYEGTLTW